MKEFFRAIYVNRQRKIADRALAKAKSFAASKQFGLAFTTLRSAASAISYYYGDAAYNDFLSQISNLAIDKHCAI